MVRTCTTIRWQNVVSSIYHSNLTCFINFMDFFVFLTHLHLFVHALSMQFQQNGIEPTGSAAIGIIRMVTKSVINLLWIQRDFWKLSEHSETTCSSIYTTLKKTICSLSFFYEDKVISYFHCLWPLFVFFLKQKTLWRHHLSKDNDNTDNKDNILQIDSDLVVFLFNLESSIIRNKFIQKWNVFFFKEEYILSLYLKVKYENFCM